MNADEHRKARVTGMHINGGAYLPGAATFGRTMRGQEPITYPAAESEESRWITLR